MDFEVYREEIEEIKLAVSTASRRGVPREHTLTGSIERLLDYYAEEPKNEYLTGALLNIQAYLELGMEYSKYEDLFERVLRKGNLDKREVFPKPFYSARKVKLNKSQVRGMIRKWSTSSKNTMPIPEVVEDIITKVKNREKGVYYYHNHVTGSGMEDDIYELVIQGEECYFHDIKWGRYYVFKE